MAKISDPLYLRWRSTHGAITGTSSRVGACARAHSAPLRRYNSLNRSLIKRQSELLLMWRSLDQSVRDEWDQFGLDNIAIDKYGESYLRSGFDWFVSMASRRMLYLETDTASPPALPDPDWSPTTYCYWDALFIVIRCYADPPPTGDQIMVIGRSLNHPISVVSPPTPIPSYKFFPASSWPVPAVAFASEILPGQHAHFFSLLPLDEWGRSPGKTFSRLETDL